MSLHLIYRNDKYTVPVIASNTMLEVLKKACQHYKIDDSRFQLTYGQQTVNLSLPYRLSGIPNLSRVTIVEKKGVTVSSVKIAIQMDDGKRFQSNFKTSSTLWDILLLFETTESGLQLTNRYNNDNQYIEPTFNILNREYTTIETLQNSSLSSINVSEATMAKLTFKQTNRSKDEISKIIESYIPPTPPTTTVTNTPPTPTNTSTTKYSPNSNTTTQTTTVTRPPYTSSISITPPNTSSFSITPPPPLPETTSPSTTTSFTDSPTLNHLINNSKLHAPPTTTTTTTTDNSSTTRMDIDQPPTTTTTTTNSNNNNNVTVEVKTPPKLITMNAEERELSVYLPSDVQINPSSIKHNEKMTEEDFKRLMESNKRAKKEKDEFDSVLRTKAMREREAYKKLKNFSTTTIRLVLPGQKFLEMKFLIRERISNLKDYINSLFSEPIDSIYLYTTPPNKVLDLNTTFLKEGLFPRSKIFLGLPSGVTTITFNEQVNQLFENAINNKSTATTTTTITQEEQDEMDKQTELENEQTRIQEDKQRELEIEIEKERQRSLRSMFNNEKEGDQKKQQSIPKWFSAGKK